MCGIAGMFLFNESIRGTDENIKEMLHNMKHRGPDGSGVFSDGQCTLGQVRLAVIDTTDAAKQPMTIDGATLVYNGELYNFIEEKKLLRLKGVEFKSRSDSEVLLQMYHYYGDNFLKRLRGMYAFAIWDSRKQKLICARDPLGVKPFLYSMDSDRFIFASELKALLASRIVSREIDMQSLRYLLQRGSVPQPNSIFKEVKTLLPGEVLIIEKGRHPAIMKFHKMKPDKLDLKGAGWKELVSLCREKLDKSLERQMISDVPLGAFLSGGIDSSLLTALMRQKHDNVRTFSVGFENGINTQSKDETEDAEQVARYLGINHTTIVVRQNEIIDNLHAIAKGLDHPTVDGVNSWFVAKAARSELTVAISGTGGDELFAGYPWFESMLNYNSVSRIEKFRRWKRRELFSSVFEKQYYIFDNSASERLCQGDYSDYSYPDPIKYADTLSRVSGMVLSGYTRDQLLADIDTASMCHGLEVRVPFLDEDLLDFALSLPTDAKIGGKDISAQNGSYASTGVKRILLEIGKPLLPEGFAQRTKRGFTLPFDGWLRGILYDTMQLLLSEQTVRQRGFFNSAEVKNTLDAFINGRDHWTRPWLLMMTELWAQEVIDQPK
jgi:asparagine synthase (glutamine-hydrolysing)